MSDDRDRMLEDLRGSFQYAWLVFGVIDVVAGVFGSFQFMEGADLNQGGAQLALLGIVLASSVVAFFCGSQFRADRNRAKLVDNAQALVNTYKAAADKVERDSANRIQQIEIEKEHEITRLTTQLEGERTRVTQAVGLLAEEVTRRVLSEEMRVITNEEIEALFEE